LGTHERGAGESSRARQARLRHDTPEAYRATYGAAPASEKTIPVGAILGLVQLPNVDAILAWVLGVVLLGFVIALAVAFWRELRIDTVFLESLDVPAELAQKGFHSSVVAAHLLDEAVAIQQRGSGWRRRRRLENVASVADMQAPGGYLSIRAIVKSARAMLGRPATRISGDITRKGDGYVLRLRLQGRVVEPVAGPHQPTMEIEQLIHDGAQDLLQAVDPFALASFFFNGPEAGTAAPNTMRLVQAVLRTEHVEDRAWALSLWASVLLGQGREDEAMEKYRAALDADERIGSQHALENLAKMLVRHGREDEAIALVDGVAARRPVDPGPRRRRRRRAPPPAQRAGAPDPRLRAGRAAPLRPGDRGAPALARPRSRQQHHRVPAGMDAGARRPQGRGDARGQRGGRPDPRRPPSAGGTGLRSARAGQA